MNETKKETQHETNKQQINKQRIGTPHSLCYHNYIMIYDGVNICLLLLINEVRPLIKYNE